MCACTYFPFCRPRLRSRPEHISSASLDSTWSISLSSLLPSSPSPKTTNSHRATVSFGSQHRVQSREAARRRGTLGASRVNRPLSDASLEMLEGYEVSSSQQNMYKCIIPWLSRFG